MADARIIRVKAVEEVPIEITIKGPRGSGKTLLANCIEKMLIDGAPDQITINHLVRALGYRPVAIIEETT